MELDIYLYSQNGNLKLEARIRATLLWLGSPRPGNSLPAWTSGSYIIPPLGHPHHPLRTGEKMPLRLVPLSWSGKLSSTLLFLL